MSRKSHISDESSKKDSHGEIIRLFCELGPLNHLEVAQRLSISKSSVDRYYRRLLRRRIALKPNVNRWALGLRRVVVRVTFFSEFEEHARQICEALQQVAYLAYFARLMPGNEWQLQFQVPLEHEGKLWQFLTNLEELNVLTVIEIYHTDIHSVASFQVEHFDFRRMKFDFDWKSIEVAKTLPDLIALYDQRISFDLIDLKILESLQSETATIAEISRRTGLDRWACYWHWKHHIWGNIIKDWYVFWPGTEMIDREETKAMARRELVCVNIFARSLSNHEVMELREKLRSIPYLWSEIVGKSDLVAQLFFPYQSLADAYTFLGSFDESLKSKMVIRTEDQRSAILYTVPSHLYDEERGWTFESDNLVKNFGHLAVKLKERSSG